MRSERRRTWSDRDKLAIVRETLAPGAVAQAVAERHGIGTGLLYTWRRQMLLAAMTGFAAVEIRPEAAAVLQVADGTAAPSPAAAQPEVPSAAEATTSPARPCLIEVELPAGVRLRVRADVDGPALRRVLDPKLRQRQRQARSGQQRPAPGCQQQFRGARPCERRSLRQAGPA